MSNACGTCSLCCKLLGIHEINKPALKWCDHCIPGKGCQVYETRPESCRIYRCMWLAGIEDGENLPLSWRPDKSKVVLTATTDENVIAVHVDPAFPTAHEKPDMARIINDLVLNKGKHVIISTKPGNKKTMLTRGPTDTIIRKTITMSDPDENGMQHYEPVKG